MSYEFATECGLSKDRIHNIAESVAELLNYEPGDDLEPVVLGLGGGLFSVGDDEFDVTVDGSIRVDAPANFQIYVAEYSGPLRSRFTIAHELGHYFLHFDPDLGPMKAARYGTGRVEWEANWFAAGFLMPETKFRGALDAADGYLMDVSSEFRVSLSAAEIRAKNLGLDVA